MSEGLLARTQCLGRFDPPPPPRPRTLYRGWLHPRDTWSWLSLTPWPQPGRPLGHVRLPVGQDSTCLPATLNSGWCPTLGQWLLPGPSLRVVLPTGGGGGWKSSFGGGDVAVCPTLGNSSAHVVAPHGASGCLLGARPQGHVHGHLLLASSGLDFIRSCIHSANIGWPRVQSSRETVVLRGCTVPPARPSPRTFPSICCGHYCLVQQPRSVHWDTSRWPFSVLFASVLGLS